ncbi:v-SNARE family protein [Tieghemostelium lacteum]|uniref:V-SNARE family protein n=1 Tax=Tieghemostelium lacteum TaxID=361077 RepID=A0A151ZRW3_TIELA|nr:v-SNARE family protein [Tieghemostelium lacteum]|eukprot:KYQ96761.1 v-SNARE family protein [Tieghemostelium lacteum]
MLRNNTDYHNSSSGGSGGTTTSSGLEDLYKQSNKLVFTIRSDIELMETGKDTVFIQTRLLSNINELARMTDVLDGMVSNEPINKREIWRIKIKQMVEECSSLRKSMEGFISVKYKKQLEDEERRKLLMGYKKGDGSAMGNLMKENDILKGADHGMDNLAEQGNSILFALVGQNAQLKNVHKKIYDIANTLGFSRAVLQKIKRRQFMDKIIVYTGMFIVLIIVFILWYYFR